MISAEQSLSRVSSERSVVQDQVRRRLPDEVLDRAEVQVRVQDLVVAEKLDPILCQGSAVLGLQTQTGKCSKLFIFLRTFLRAFRVLKSLNQKNDAI